MKRFFTLLGLGIVGMASTQAVVRDLSSVKCEGLTNPAEVQQMVDQMNKCDILEKVERGEAQILRSYSDNQYVYQVILENSGLWLTEFWSFTMQDGTAATIEDLPMMVARYYLLRGPKSTGKYDTQMLSWISWPTHRWLEDDGSLELLTVDEFINYPNNSCNFAYYGLDTNTNINILGGTDNGQYVWGIWSNELRNQDGSYSDMSRSIYENSYTNFSEPTSYSRTNFTLKTYDADDEDFLESDNAFYLTNGQTVAVEYAGSADVDGFVKYDNVFDLGEVHVFYGGEVGTEILGLDNDPYWYPFGFPEVESWGPLQKFYIMGTSNMLKVCLTDGQYISEDPQPFNSDHIGVTTVTGGDIEDKDFYFFRGAIYNAADAAADQPYGKWSLIDTEVYFDREYNMNIYTINPIAGAMVPYGYDKDAYPWSSMDGFQIAWKASRRNLASCETENGTTEGGSMVAYDNTGSSYTAKWNGDIIFHYDANDMTKTRKVPSIGSLEGAVNAVLASGNRISAANGVISVIAEADAEAAVYTLTGACVASQAVKAGETVNFKADKGIYVVKVGSEAKKVVL